MQPVHQRSGDRLAHPSRPGVTRTRRSARVRPRPASRVRLVLARRPWLYWSVVAATAALAAVVAMRPAHEAATERDRWGELVTVVVAHTDVAAGTALDPSRVEERQYPRTVVPDGAVVRLNAGEVAVARRAIGAGEIVTRVDVAPRDGPAALAEPGQVVVGVRETVPSDVRIGDVVIVTTEGVVLAEDATVAGVRDDVVMLAVDRDAAPMVAAAAAGSVGVSLLLVP